MGIDLDPLDEIFAEEGVKTARPESKFQPKAKAKFRPTKKNSAALSVSSSKPAQSVDRTAVGLAAPAEAPKPSENCPDVSDDNKSHRVSPEKLEAMNADVLIELESLGDIPQSNTPDMSSASLSKFLNSQNGEGYVNPFPSSVDDATHGSDVSKCNEISADQDPLTSGEPVVSSGDGCGQLPNEELHREEMDIMDSINMSASTTKSEQRRRKFQPKQKRQNQKKIHKTNESVSCSLGSQFVQPESNSAGKDSVSTFHHDDMMNLSDLGITHTLPTEVTPGIPLAEESVNLMESTNVVPEVPAKLTSRRARTQRSKTQTALDPSPQQEPACTSGEVNELRRSSRKGKGKTNLYEPVDEDEEEVVAGGEISDENPLDPALEEDNVLNEDSHEENESQKKRTKRKAKKPDVSEEKPTRKRKKDEGANAKPKKFSHSTQRRVNKDLLAIPEDEIEYQKVPLRDLLVLADYRERQMKRDEVAASAATTATKQSNGNSSIHSNEYGPFNSREDGEYDDEQVEPEMEDTTVFFNYHSHMDRTPATRWSKQETELFYEGVRQFGTDLSMIQQLFPDRTRRQVKLKYKKEERQHPLRLQEALTTRSTDHSHYERVIQHLKEMAAEENRNYENDDPVDLTGKDEDEDGDAGTCDVGKEEAKDEEIEEVEATQEDVANDVEVESPSKLEDNDEDDQFFWTYSST